MVRMWLLLLVLTWVEHLLICDKYSTLTLIHEQLGILAILAQIGCFIPAESAEFPPFTALFTRIGASDNQSRGVSTFMSEMIDMSNILTACERNDPHANSLIIVDELGRGTSTLILIK